MADDRLDRRTALKGLGAAALAPVVGSGCDPVEPEPDPGVPARSLDEAIDTVVILMMENRSFDSYFGALSLEEGRTDIDGLQPGMGNPHPDGSVIAPYPAVQNCIADPPHGWNASHSQFNDGNNDGFVAQHANRHGNEEAHRVMQYFGRDKLGPLYAMAEQHVLCERWFCSLMSSTWPNRYYSHAAQNGGQHGNSLPEDSFPSIYSRLDEAGIPWNVYFGNAPFMFLLEDVQAGDNIKAFEDFASDAQFGRLPAVSVIEPIYGRNDDHPPAHPVAGQILISSVYQALAASPHWDRCAFIVTYDEHGGFFDHVPPPLAADDRADEGFDQLGFRVPTVVSGPWTRQGYVSSAIFDHTSILAFLERRFGLEPLTTRDAAANDMYELFDQARIDANDPLPPAELPVIEADINEIYAPECVLDILGRDEEILTTQPELEAAIAARAPGSQFDRLAQTDALYASFLATAEQQGIWRSKG
jgi:phospholipase C